MLLLTSVLSIRNDNGDDSNHSSDNLNTSGPNEDDGG